MIRYHGYENSTEVELEATANSEEELIKRLTILVKAAGDQVVEEVNESL